MGRLGPTATFGAETPLPLPLAQHNRRWVRVDDVAEACRGFGWPGEGSGGASL